MDKRPTISIIVPIHNMANGEFFLWRLINSLTSQTFKDWELIITKDGKMAENTNSGIKRARGEWIKVLYLDDYFSDSTSLDRMLLGIADAKQRRNVDWVICGTNNNIKPYWTDDIETGNNKLGSPSALIFRNDFKNNILFDETLSWLLDCDFYKRKKDKWGYPLILEGNYVILGEGEHQMTYILTDEQKLVEYNYMQQKYGG